MGTTYCLPSTSMVVRMPQHRCHNLSSSSWGGCPSAVWLLTLFFAGLLNHSCSWSVYIIAWIVPLFYTILSCCRSKHQCWWCIGVMCNGVGWLPLSHSITHSCHVSILCYCNMPRTASATFIFFVRKFLQLPVQAPMGFLTRPVTGYDAHDNARTHNDRRDYECSVDHSSVPSIVPSTTATTMAVTNMPVMMYNKSI